MLLQSPPRNNGNQRQHAIITYYALRGLLVSHDGSSNNKTTLSVHPQTIHVINNSVRSSEGPLIHFTDENIVM